MLFGGRLGFDYPGYFERLAKLHAETGSEMVRAKAEEAIAYFAQDGKPEIKTLASEALNRLHHVAGTCPSKGGKSLNNWAACRQHRRTSVELFGCLASR